jgi:hypothetical protein
MSYVADPKAQKLGIGVANWITIHLGCSSIEGVAAMPTRNVNLTDKLDRFVAKKVESGCYENASEVVRGATDSVARGTAVRGEARQAASRN